MSSAICRPFCFGLNVLTNTYLDIWTKDEGIVWQDSDHPSEYEATKIVRRIFQQVTPWNKGILYQWGLTNLALVSMIICWRVRNQF